MFSLLCSSVRRRFCKHGESDLRQSVQSSEDEVDSNSPSSQASLEGHLLSETLACPDEAGILLSSVQHQISSPNGEYALQLGENGNLVLGHRAPQGALQPLWWTGTGDGRTRRNYDVSISLSEDSRSILEVSVQEAGHRQIVWHSDLHPACKLQALSNDTASEESRSKGCLKLSNVGRLTLSNTCDLYKPPFYLESPPSLAVIVAGLYRTNNITCETHSKALFSHQAFTSVDVFAFIVYEDRDVRYHNRTKSSIEGNIRQCYGERLKAVTVVATSDIEEAFPGSQEDADLEPCRRKVRRLNNQLKTLYEASRMWWAWAIEHGVLHDAVLRIRPDTNFYGGETLEFRDLNSLGHNRLVLVQPSGERYFYCPRITGHVGIGPSDQIAYGSPSAMSHYLQMYTSFSDTISFSRLAHDPMIVESLHHVRSNA
ncbi:hypothetical protein jhhlp_004064 [Lomentospora prolificans]|uniref:Bulb-type lectin domain-containing protein n=1 Tax=Lomentospora prolificans TaxID=41688 RepID=A0A2N3NAI4_9PEZI|nr:hypothetical protein jhhlp_004064 [Lomentospora prolificans]